MDRPLWAAHRGGAALWAENSLLAFGNALALGAPLVECDVHLTRDGEVVVVHDPALGRVTDGDGVVGDLAAADLRRFRLRDPRGEVTEEHVPTLTEILALLAPSPAGLLLEVKGPGPAVCWERAGDRVRAVPGPRYEGLEARALALVDAAGMRARTTVIAFNPDVLAAVHALDRDRGAPRVSRGAPSARGGGGAVASPHDGTRTGLLVGAGHARTAGATAADLLDVAVALGATDVGLDHRLVDAALVDAAHRRGLAVGAWTVDDAADMRRLAGFGIDVLTTDRPDRAREVFGGLR